MFFVDLEETPSGCDGNILLEKITFESLQISQ